MQRQLALYLALGFSGVVNAGDGPMESNPEFEVTAACKGQAPCVFNGRRIDFDINVKNIRDTPIHLPLEFIRHGGPSIVLHDNRRRSELTLPSHMLDDTLLTNLTVLAPGQSVSVSGSIDASYLEQSGGAAADVTAVLTLGAPLDGAPAFRLIGNAQLRILGARAAERQR